MRICVLFTLWREFSCSLFLRIGSRLHLGIGGGLLLTDIFWRMITRSSISFRVLRSSRTKLFFPPLSTFPFHLQYTPFQSFYRWLTLSDSFFQYPCGSLSFLQHFLNSSPQLLLHSFPPQISVQKQNYGQAHSLQQCSTVAISNFQ